MWRRERWNDRCWQWHGTRSKFDTKSYADTERHAEPKPQSKRVPYAKPGNTARRRRKDRGRYRR